MDDSFQINTSNTFDEAASIGIEICGFGNDIRPNYGKTESATKDSFTVSGYKVPANMIFDVKETAEAVRDAANEIKLISEELPGKTEEFVAHTEQLVAQINLITTRITMNIAILIVLVFCLSVTFYIVKRKTAFSRK